MASRAFVIPLRDLEDAPRTVNDRLTDDWLRQNLSDTDVSPAGTDDGQVKLVLTKNGRDVLVQGRVSATIELPCARTLDPARYPISAEVFLLLSPKGGARTESGPSKKGPEKRTRRSAKGDGKGRGGREEAEEADRLLSTEEAAADHYQGDEVVLDDFLREFILLEVPMVPLREDLRSTPFEGNPSPPEKQPLDPRLSPLAEIKARLEKKE